MSANPLMVKNSELVFSLNVKFDWMPSILSSFSLTPWPVFICEGAVSKWGIWSAYHFRHSAYANAKDEWAVPFMQENVWASGKRNGMVHLDIDSRDLAWFK